LTDARARRVQSCRDRAPEAVMRLSSGRKTAPERASLKSGGFGMRKALTVFDQFANDEDGAALIEYTVLLGIMLVAVVATIGLVGTWIGGQWIALNTAL